MFEILPMVPSDWPAVQSIYQEGIDGGLATFEVAAPPWEEWDVAHHPFARFVARREGEVIGWVALSPVSRRACYAGVAEVSVYVATGWHGRGAGRELLEAAIREAEARGLWTLQGATFAHNQASLALLARCGFRVIGRRERIAQRHGTWLDTVLTERRSRVVGWDGP